MTEQYTNIPPKGFKVLFKRALDGLVTEVLLPCHLPKENPEHPIRLGRLFPHRKLGGDTIYSIELNAKQASSARTFRRENVCPLCSANKVNGGVCSADTRADTGPDGSPETLTYGAFPNSEDAKEYEPTGFTTPIEAADIVSRGLGTIQTLKKDSNGNFVIIENDERFGPNDGSEPIKQHFTHQPTYPLFRVENLYPIGTGSQQRTREPKQLTAAVPTQDPGYYGTTPNFNIDPTNQVRTDLTMTSGIGGFDNDKPLGVFGDKIVIVASQLFDKTFDAAEKGIKKVRNGIEEIKKILPFRFRNK